MKYIPGTLVISPNQLSIRLLPKLNSQISYKLIHVKPVKENNEIKNIHYYFLELVKPPVVKAVGDLDKVILSFKSIEEAEMIFDKILGVKTVSQPREEQQTKVSDVTRSKLNNIAAKSFTKRRR